MMVFNGFLNSIIVFSVIVLCLIDSFIIKPYLSKQEKVIAYKENEIFKAKDLDTFKRNFLVVNAMSDKYAKKVMLFKALKFTLIGIAVCFVLCFSKQFETIGVLFYFTISMCLERGITTLFEIAENQKENNLAKAKLNNLINRN